MKFKTFMINISLLTAMAACTNQTTNDNPLLNDFSGIHETPPFSKIKVEHYVPAVKAAIAEAKKEIDAITNNKETPTFENTVLALEESGQLLSRVLGIFHNLNEAETSPEMQAAAREISPLVTEHNNDISLNENLFKRIKEVYDNRDKLSLNDEQIMLLTKRYEGFVKNGANLAPELRERFREINKELSQLSLQYNENDLAETNDFILHITDSNQLSGLTESIIEAAAFEAKERNMEGWVFSLHLPSYYPFMQYADNRQLREKMYKAYVSRCNHNNEHDNKKIVEDIVNKRLERSKMLGYNSYADYVLEDRMAESVTNVNTFLDEIFEASHPIAKKEKLELEKFARSLGFEGELPLGLVVLRRKNENAFA